MSELAMAKEAPLRRYGVIAATLCILISPRLHCDTSGNQYPAPNKVGLLMNLGAGLFDVNEYSDNFQSGIGIKKWMPNNSAIRGLVNLHLYYHRLLEQFHCSCGIGFTYEKHLSSRILTPFCGFTGGAQFAVYPKFSYDIYGGAILGAEAHLLDYLSLFVEYDLLLEFGDAQYALDLGIGNNAQIGLIIYLN